MRLLLDGPAHADCGRTDVLGLLDVLAKSKVAAAWVKDAVDLIASRHGDDWPELARGLGAHDLLTKCSGHVHSAADAGVRLVQALAGTDATAQLVALLDTI